MSARPPADLPVRRPLSWAKALAKATALRLLQAHRPVRLRRLATLAQVLALAGCAAAGPDDQRPSLRLPVSVQPASDALLPLSLDERASGHAPASPTTADGASADAEALEAATSARPASGRWWTQFRAPALDALIERSLREHPGVAAGQAALRQAEAFVRAQQGSYAPQLQAGYAVSRQRTANVLASPLADSSYVFNLHTLQLNLAYTPDVFGATQRAVEGLQAGVVTQRALLDATRLSLAANVAMAAIQEASLRAQLEALDETLGIQRDLLRRTAALQRAGQLGELDRAAQEAALAALEAQEPPLVRALGQTRDLLKALVGAYPDEVLGARFALADLHLPPSAPHTLPSTVVAQRPDIRAAEAQLQAANAAIGVAAAARLPTLTLGVNAYGESGSRLGDLLRSANSFWTLAGGVTQPLFDGGTLAAREHAARAAWQQAEQLYRLTVINAFQNVADALIALHTDGQASATAWRAEQAARRSFDIASRQHALGDLGAIALAQQQQAWLQARTQRIVAEASRLGDTVALYQALGGDGDTALTGPTPGVADALRP